MIIPWHFVFIATLFHPIPCTDVCHLEGPGGFVPQWIEYVDDAVQENKSFVVDGYCASACAIATGYAISSGAKVTIYDSALLVPHNKMAIIQHLMPVWYKKLMLDYKPFRLGFASSMHRAMFNF